MTATIDEARNALLEMTKPGVVTDHELSYQAGQKITQARFAYWAQAKAVYPTQYPPPPAGDGSDVFKAADEGGEGMCTRKEIAKYLMRNQTLRHRLREGWAKFNSNFGTEDTAENHEELSKEQFCKLWAEAAALRIAAESGKGGSAPHADPAAGDMDKKRAEIMAKVAEARAKLQKDQPKFEDCPEKWGRHKHQCSECGVEPIVGFRWGCTKLKQYDICGNCFADIKRGETYLRKHKHTGQSKKITRDDFEKVVVLRGAEFGGDDYVAHYGWGFVQTDKEGKPLKEAKAWGGAKVKPNDPCPCASGIKFKKCCGKPK